MSLRTIVNSAWIVLLFFAAATIAAPTAGASNGTCKQPVTISAKDDAALRDAFNKARGSVRLIFLMDPICPYCLKGLKDLDELVLSPHASDARLNALIVHTPVLGATEADIANTCAIVHNDRVTHYWDPNQELGTVFANALDMKDGDRVIYAWDVWLVYGPDAEWVGDAPPKADFLMHQLPDLLGRDGFPFLRAPVFRDEVEKRLKTIAPPQAAGPAQ